ncbi:type II secretion system protein GspJ, partial [Escherichia coli]|nr:type II secretion system protein GspJ [Escherichia coli]
GRARTGGFRQQEKQCALAGHLHEQLTDAAGSVKPTMQKLIPADSLRLQFYDGTRWQESWSSVQAIPVAVRMTLHSPQWGEIERIWLLRGPQ